MSQTDLIPDLPSSPVPESGKPKKFKLRHKPTGLYWRPNRGFRGIMQKIPNVTKRGKTYLKPPTLPKTWITDKQVREYTIAEDWEVVEV